MVQITVVEVDFAFQFDAVVVAVEPRVQFEAVRFVQLEVGVVEFGCQAADLGDAALYDLPVLLI